MILSRSKPAVDTSGSHGLHSSHKVLPKLEDFLSARDYTGALTLLEFNQGSGKTDDLTDKWVGYCAFHLGDYKRALAVYEQLIKQSKDVDDILVNLACAQFYLGLYSEAEAGITVFESDGTVRPVVNLPFRRIHPTEARVKTRELFVEQTLERAPDSLLKTRLLFHLDHKHGAEDRLLARHKELENVVENQLSLAAIHYLRVHYQEAIDIYKQVLLHNSDYLALNVYVALCYYKLDYYDISQQVLSVYLQNYPDSVSAINLKACNNFRLYNGKVAESEIKALMDQTSSTLVQNNDLIRHNLIVFRGGEGALQVLPPLVDVIPEARLNLVIFYLKQDEIREAYHLIKDLAPSVPSEYNLKGVVNAAMGQETGSREHIKMAHQYFQLVGSSPSECDTVPGRQCMANSFFLIQQFKQVLTYLNSIKSYFYNDDSFNYNYAQAKCAVHSYKEAEEKFLLIQNEKILNDYVYISHLTRCYIMNGKPHLAWEQYLRMETSAESFSLLLLIGNDCYRLGHFWFAAKAFDMLDRLDPSPEPEHWEGKRGACAGAFALVVAGKQPKELIPDILALLRNTTNSQVEPMIKTIKRWAKDNRANL